MDEDPHGPPPPIREFDPTLSLFLQGRGGSTIPPTRDSYGLCTAPFLSPPF